MQKAWNEPGAGPDRMRAPGTCADCGGDAYIRMGAPNVSVEMLCAHCYAERLRSGDVAREAPKEAYRVSGIRAQ